MSLKNASKQLFFLNLTSKRLKKYYNLC